MKDIIVEHDQLISTMQEEVRDKICESFRMGCSVAQISRALMCHTFQFAYRIVQIDRQIGNAPTRYTPRFVPEKLLGTFRAVKHSFPKWAISHHFDIAQADKALAGPPAKGDNFSIMVHQALKNDFRFLYDELYRGAPPKGQIRRFDHTYTQRKSLQVLWREDLDCYRAHVPEMPEVWAVGETPDMAFRAIKFTFNLRRQVLRLNRLIAAQEKLRSRKRIAVWE